MSWYENIDNSNDQDALTKQQNAYIRAFYDNPGVLTNLRLIVDHMPTTGMSAAEAALARGAQECLLFVIRRNAGVCDELRVVQAEGNIARATVMQAQEQKNRLEGYED